MLVPKPSRVGFTWSCPLGLSPYLTVSRVSTEDKLGVFWEGDIAQRRSGPGQDQTRPRSIPPVPAPCHQPSCGCPSNSLPSFPRTFPGLSTKHSRTQEHPCSWQAGLAGQPSASNIVAAVQLQRGLQQGLHLLLVVGTARDRALQQLRSPTHTSN